MFRKFKNRGLNIGGTPSKKTRSIERIKKVLTTSCFAMLLATSSITSNAAVSTVMVDGASGSAPDLTFSNNFVANGWNTEPFTITVSGSDLETGQPLVGISKRYRYRDMYWNEDWNNSTRLDTTTPVLNWYLDTKGTTLQFQCYNASEEGYSNASEVTFKYDGTAPTVEWARSLGNNIVEISAIDYTSGVVAYGVSSSKDIYPTNWSSSNQVRVNGSGNFYAFAKDEAGNIGMCKYPVNMNIPISSCTITGLDTKTYTGSPVTLKKLKLWYFGHNIYEGEDYIVSYKNNVNAGTATVTITGIGNFVGSVDKTFKIDKAEQKFNFDSRTIDTNMRAADFNLNEKLKIGDGKITYKSSNNKVFKISKKNRFIRKGPGIAYLIITASETANFKEKTVKCLVKVRPTDVTYLKASSKKKGQIKVQWCPEDYNSTGYKIQVATNKRFTNAKTYTVNGRNKVTKIIKGLKKGKKYYVRIRSYKTNKEGTVYGEWSIVKSIKVKK